MTTNTIGNDDKNLITIAEYDDASRLFRHYWTDIQNTEELVKQEVVRMLIALEAGFSHMKAIEK